MTDTDLIQSLSPLEVVAATIYGEARGERIEGRVAVGCVIRNRVKARRYGKDYPAVCLAPYQFSCWLHHDKAHQENFETLMLACRQLKRDELTPLLRECVWVAGGILDDDILDSTRASTHYITRALWESHPPKWAVGLTPVIGIDRHVFFSGVDN
jgi:N-acetylmuramoyl-L-alanine amidase